MAAKVCESDEEEDAGGESEGKNMKINFFENLLLFIFALIFLICYIRML